MATLREVKKRIKSVVSTRRITSAMEMVAAANLRRAQQKVEETRPYSRKMDEMLGHLAAASSDDISHPYFDERDVKKKTLVVFASDRGLCGSFNSNVFRRAFEWLEQNKDFEVEIVAVGKKADDIFKRRRWPVVASYMDWEGKLNFDKVQEIVSFLAGRFVNGETDQIDLAFTRFLSTVRYKLVVEGYLPVARPQTGGDSEGRSDYIFEPSPEAIYGALMPRYATTKMVAAVAESLASEHGSRMMAMSNATTNAGDMIQSLTLEYNKARQAQITKELLEVVSGAEALAG